MKLAYRQIVPELESIFRSCFKDQIWPAANLDFLDVILPARITNFYFRILGGSYRPEFRLAFCCLKTSKRVRILGSDFEFWCAWIMISRINFWWWDCSILCFRSLAFWLHSLVLYSSNLYLPCLRAALWAEYCPATKSLILVLISPWCGWDWRV